MANELDFSGKVALITGAASGLGAATARWLDAHGIAELVLVDLDRPALSELGLSCKVTPFGGNLGGTFLALRCAMRSMGRPGSGGARGGSIVLTGSVLGLRATAPIDYGASKAAVANMAQIAGREGAPHGIRVNAVSPGGMDTPIGYAMDMVRQEAGRLGTRTAALEEMARASVPLGKFTAPDEIAGQIGFLLSDLAALITGTVLVSDRRYSI